MGDGFLIQTNTARRTGRVVADRSAREPARRELERRRAGAARSHGERQHGGRQAVRHLSQGRDDARVRRTRWTASSRTRSRCPGLGIAGGFGGNNDDKLIFYTFTSFNCPPTIYRYDIATRKSTLFRAPEIPGFTAARLRDEAGVLHEQGRHARADVHRPPQGAEARRQQSDAAVRLRRIQRDHDAGLQLAAPGAARAGRRLRVGEPARRRRVRRDVAPGGHEAEEAERLRRLHRRGRVADREQVHVARPSWRSRARRTAACSSARSRISGRSCSSAVVQQAGVMDMLRFHKFTIGWNWVADYGSSDNEAEFKVLARLLADPQHQGGREISGDADHDGRPRRPRRAGAFVQVRGGTAGRAGGRQPAS